MLSFSPGLKDIICLPCEMPARSCPVRLAPPVRHLPAIALARAGLAAGRALQWQADEAYFSAAEYVSPGQSYSTGVDPVG